MSKKKVPVNKLEKAVDAIVSRLEKAEKFVLDQAPDVCKEIVKEKSLLSIYDIVAYTVLMVGMIKMASIGIVHMFTLEKELWPCFLAWSSGCASVLFFILALCSVRELISIKAAPKLTILRELKALVSKESETE